MMSTVEGVKDGANNCLSFYPILKVEEDYLDNLELDHF